MLSVVTRRLPLVLGVLLLASGSAVAFLALGARAGPAGAPELVTTNSALNVMDVPEYDFAANPLGDVPGTKMADATVEKVQAEGEKFPVPVLLPTTAEAAPDLFVTDAKVQEDWQMVVLNYRTSAYGPVQIFQRAQGLTQEGIDEWAESGYCTSCAFAEAITLDGGQQAVVLGTPETTTVVHWIQNGVQIDVMGPYSSLSRDAAVKLANDLSVQ